MTVVDLPAERYLSVKDVAEILGTTERFPRRLIEERRIEFVHIGKHVRIALSVLNAYIASQTVPARSVRRVG
ncbi:helix-turn-helix domain-containing protein [Umezawaea tangerina]|uniref:Excisionase family DNA binding protein n=1 Tax=Umezawaea tangerina TaxID=84725 RepID=A0A2T0SS70_9PSEU|nr:helix-turn-helix domain-containing protein [Umezawaea tangerina]PRY36262.1 excisionase family DNA binding protein [Umezawaea tangerina]